MIKSRSIQFLPGSDYVAKHIPPPKPALAYAPDWIKPKEKLDLLKVEMSTDGSVKDRFVGRCTPFRDAMNAGYIQESWTDILIRLGDDGVVEYFHPVGPKILETPNRPSGNSVGSNYYPMELLLQMVWTPKTPAGYSVLVCPPNNRLDLPFTVTSGVIDSDKFFHAPSGNIPVYIKAGFQGIIPAGTPLYQIIPFRREPWVSKPAKFDIDLQSARNAEFKKSGFAGNYRRNFWAKKSFK